MFLQFLQMGKVRVLLRCGLQHTKRQWKHELGQKSRAWNVVTGQENVDSIKLLSPFAYLTDGPTVKSKTNWITKITQRDIYGKAIFFDGNDPYAHPEVFHGLHWSFKTDTYKTVVITYELDRKAIIKFWQSEIKVLRASRESVLLYKNR